VSSLNNTVIEDRFNKFTARKKPPSKTDKYTYNKTEKERQTERVTCLLAVITTVLVVVVVVTDCTVVVSAYITTTTRHHQF